MPDFSGASLKLKAEGEDKLLATLDKIDKKAKETVGGFGRLTQSEVDKASAAFDQLYGKQSKAARQTQQVVEDVSNKVDAAMNRSARGALAVSRGFEVMARTGRETGRSLDTLLSQIGYAAFGFGAQGALVGAVAISVAAIVELFNRTGAELDKMVAQYDRQTEHLMRSGSLIAVDAQRTALYSGQFSIREKGESDVSFLGRSQGLLGLGAEASRINTQINAIQNRKGLHFESDAKDVADLRDRLTEVNAQVGILGTQWSILGQREKTEMDIAARNAETALEKANNKRKKELKDPYRKEEGENLRFAPTVGFGQQGIPKDFLDDISLTHQIAEVVNPDSDQAKADKFAIEENVKRTIEGIKNMWFSEADQLAKQMQERVGQTIGAALESGFAAAFEKGGNIGKGITALTKTLLAGLGSMFAQIAEKALIASQFMMKIVGFLTTNPWLAAAAAAAMLAFASSLGSGSSGGGGGGYSGSGSLNAISTVGTLAPQAPVTNPSHITPRPSNTYNVTVIGKDAKAWREVQEQLDQNARRG